MTGNFGLVFRGDCEFGAKALAAQNAGAIAVIIADNIPGGPIEMGAGAVGSGVTIPTIMISQADGLAIANQINNGQTVTASFTLWGSGQTNDLGILNTGYTQYHSMVTPLSQMMANNGNPGALMAYDGAFIANLGSSDETNVKLESNVTFTPQAGGAAQQVHNGSFTFANFPQADSIYAVSTGAAYNVHPTVKGTYDVTYTLSMDNPDQYTANNSKTHSYVVSDDIYCKGRYDFTKNAPTANIYFKFATAGTPITAGNFYFVPIGGTFKALSAQYTCAGSNANEGGLSGETSTVLLYRWADTLIVDSLVEFGELQLIGINTKTHAPTDSTGDAFEQNFLDVTGAPIDIVLDSNAWYFAAVELSDQTFMGYDGITNYFPRTFLRQHATPGFTEFYSTNIPANNIDIDADIVNNPTTLLPSHFPFEGSLGLTAGLTVDSARYAQQRKGFVPAVALKIAPVTAMATSNVRLDAKLDLYPNPTNNELNISVVAQKSTSALYYTIVDITGKKQYYTAHKNIVGKSDNFVIDTKAFANGTYILVVSSAEGTSTVKKFVIAH
jgi:hypothetical protein